MHADGLHALSQTQVISLVDRLEMFETVIFSVQLTTSIRVCVQLIDSTDIGGFITFVSKRMQDTREVFKQCVQVPSIYASVSCPGPI